MAPLCRDRFPIVISRPFNYAGVGQTVSLLLPARRSEVKLLLGTRARLDSCIWHVAVIDLREPLRWMIDAPVSEPDFLGKR